jgi:hypothetical protein
VETERISEKPKIYPTDLPIYIYTNKNLHFYLEGDPVFGMKLDVRSLGLFNDDDSTLKVIHCQMKVRMIKKHKAWIKGGAEKGIAVECF